MSGNVALITEDLFVVRVIEVLLPSDAGSRQLKEEFVTSSTFTLPWTRRIALVSYAIASLCATMGRLTAIAWMFSFLIYVKAF